MVLELADTLDASGRQPRFEVGRVEADELADLVERHTSLLDQATDEPWCNGKMLSSAFNVEQRVSAHGSVLR